MDREQLENDKSRLDTVFTSQILTKSSSVFDFNFPIYIYALMLFFVSIISTGYHIFYGHQTLELPIVYLFNNPSLYPKDPFAATLPYYASPLWRVLALCVSIVPLERLILTLFLLERLLVICAAGYLAWTFTPGSKLAVVGAMILFTLAPMPILGDGTLVLSYFEHTGFSIPFFLLAIASFYRERPILWAIFLSIGFSLNSMYGIYAMTYFSAVFLLDSNYRERWKRWIYALVLFLVLALPTILLTLSAFKVNTTDNKLWLLASQARSAHHLYPLAWSPFSFLQFGIFSFLLLAVLYYNRHRLEKLFRHSAIWAGVSLLWLVYAFVAAYVVKSPSMLVMHPARGTDLWYCFAGVALISVCAAKVDSDRTKKAVLVAIFTFSILLSCLHSSVAMHHLYIINLVTLTAIMLTIMWQPTWNYLMGNGNSSRLPFLLTLWVALLGTTALDQRIKEKGDLRSALIMRPDSSIEQIADWANRNTPLDTQILINPSWEWEDFSALSKRSVFITWAQGGGILWYRPFVKDWTERLQALGFDFTQQKLIGDEAYTELDRLYEHLRDSDIRKLKARYPLQYWVVPIVHSSNFPVAFQNQHYKVLALK